MFGLAMFIFSALVLLILDQIYVKVVFDANKEITTTSPITYLLFALTIGLLSEIGLRMAVK